MIHDTESAQISQKQDERNMCPPGYHHNVFVAHCFHDCIYLTLVLHLWDFSTVCCGSLMTTYIMLLTELVETFLVHWYQQCVTVHLVPRCMSCHKSSGMINRGAHLVFMIGYILCSSCFCQVWALYVLWITYDHLYNVHITLIFN